jgi:hypothetical protein
MSQHFNLTRFGRLLRKHTAEYWKTYLMSTAVLLGGLVVVLGGLTYLTRRPLEREPQILLFVFILLAAGIAFTASVFADLGNARGAAPALMLPASHLEKYLVAWLYTMPVFLLVYTIVFFGVDAVTLQLGSNGKPYEMLDFSRGTREWAGPLVTYALPHGIALYCAIYYQRLHIIKTAFLILGLAAVLLVANGQMMKLFIPGSHPTAPFGDVWVGALEQRIVVALPYTTWQLTTTLVSLALAALLWAAAYARLTEKQL